MTNSSKIILYHCLFENVPQLDNDPYTNTNGLLCNEKICQGFFNMSYYWIRMSNRLKYEFLLFSFRFSLSNQRVVDELQKNNLTNLLNPLQAAFSPDAGQLTSPYSGDFCPYHAGMLCDVQFPFRSFDGSCNNIRKPIIGRAITPYSRLLPAKYDDGEYI